ncbi:MAG: diacylglycerol kinase family protein [Ferruginibacter sp.]
MKLLFIINEASGKNNTTWQPLVEDHFKDKEHTIKIIILDDSCSPKVVSAQLDEFKPQRVVAIGGDGTVKFAASCLLKTGIPLCIIPAGSANGLAKELGIPLDVQKALQLVVDGEIKSIHLVKINDELCIHLSDIGFNAFVIKKFENEARRGMWGYIKASWKVLWQHEKMTVDLHVGGKTIKKNAAMIVIANATRYGSGALINPKGDLADHLFEVIVVKKISLKEIYKMMVSHFSYDPAKTEVYQTQSLDMVSKVKAHFQVDGEYLGKVNKVTAKLLPSAINMIVPPAPVN